jgi:DNA-binding LytR/AlgR family response regulator
MMSVNISEAPIYREKSRVIGRKGNDHIVIKLDHIAFFFTKEKLVFLVDREGQKFLIDGSLQHLEERLDGDVFFRVNRQEIVSIHYIKSFRTFERLRLEIELALPKPFKLYTSQNATIAFRKWVYKH